MCLGDDYFSNYFQDLNDFFSDRFGFLYYPFEVIIKILNNFMSIDDYDLSDEKYQPQDITSSAINTRYISKNSTAGYYLKYNDCYGILVFDLSAGYTVNINFDFHTDLNSSTYFKGTSRPKSGGQVLFGSYGGSYSILGRDLTITYTAEKDTEITIDCLKYDKNNRVFFDLLVEVTPPLPENIPGAFNYPDIPEPFTRRGFYKIWNY